MDGPLVVQGSCPVRSGKDPDRTFKVPRNCLQSNTQRAVEGICILDVEFDNLLLAYFNPQKLAFFSLLC